MGGESVGDNSFWEGDASPDLETFVHGVVEKCPAEYLLHRNKELPVVKLLLRPTDDGTRSRSTIGRTASWGGTSAEAVLYSNLTAPDSSSVE